MIEQRHLVRLRVRAMSHKALCLRALTRDRTEHASLILQQCFFSCALLASLGMAGCRHKPVRSPLPIGALAPVDLESPPANVSAAIIADLPQPELGPLPSAEPPSPPRRRVPAAPKENEPAQVASNDAVAALALGAISAGGEDTTHTAQQAQDLINAVLKRIAALSAQALSVQKSEVRQIQNFLSQAQKALKSGDADSAHTLATKAGLLMDDVEKK